MAEQIPVSQKFQADPRGWTSAMVERVIASGAALKPHTRRYLTGMRARLTKDPGMRPGPNTYERLCRLARACGILARRRRIPRVDERPAAPSAVHVPERFRVGQPIPAPPLLRRPVVALGGDSTETWDPAGMPCL